MVPISVLVFSRLAQLVTSFFLFIIFAKILLASCQKAIFKKNCNFKNLYKNWFLNGGGSSFEQLKKLAHLLQSSVSWTNAYVDTISVFALSPLFYEGKWFWKMACFCARFLTLIGQTWRTLFFHSLNRTKKNAETHFSAGIWFLLLNNKKPVLPKPKKTQKIKRHHWCFFGATNPFFLILPLCFLIYLVWLLISSCLLPKPSLFVLSFS